MRFPDSHQRSCLDGLDGLFRAVLDNHLSRRPQSSPSLRRQSHRFRWQRHGTEPPSSLPASSWIVLSLAFFYDKCCHNGRATYRSMYSTNCVALGLLFRQSRKSSACCEPTVSHNAIRISPFRLTMENMFITCTPAACMRSKARSATRWLKVPLASALTAT